MKTPIYTLLMVMAFYACSNGQNQKPAPAPAKEKSSFEVSKSQDEWKKELDGLTYHVTREKGTEPAFSGKYDKFYEKGTYHCSNCGALLFSSESKFNSGSGWPSFSDVAKSGKVKKVEDSSHGMVRTEVVCQRCGAHLGHVFDDGPQPSGQRYCINSVSMTFEAEGDSTSEGQ